MVFLQAVRTEAAVTMLLQIRPTTHGNARQQGIIQRVNNTDIEERLRATSLAIPASLCCMDRPSKKTNEWITVTTTHLP